MSVLDEFSGQFNRSQSRWTREQWRQAALELASRLDSGNQTPAKRGRPRNDVGSIVVSKNGEVTVSQKGNYAALAWQVQQRMELAEAAGKKLTIKAAVREELIVAIERHNATPPDRRGKRNGVLRPSRADEMLRTAYTEVRKLLAVSKADLKDTANAKADI